MSESTNTPYLDRYTVNLSQKVAQNPNDYRVYEREPVTNRVLVSLLKQIQNSPLLVGEAGVGKTAIVEDLARQLMSSSDNSLANKSIIQISLANLMQTSDGESFAYKFQQILNELMANKDTMIAFIDEIHQIVGTGADNQGSALDAGNIIKPALSRDDLQIIGATTTKEFHQYIAQDGALMRRFDLVEVPELSASQTKNILSKVAPRLGGTLSVSDDVQAHIMALSQRYITDRFFPEKAIMLLDSAISQAKIKQRKAVTKADVADIIHADYHVPKYVINQTADERLNQLSQHLNERIIGQENPLHKITMKINNREAGLGDNSKPESFLFLGPTGVGKTETAKQLAILLFGEEENFIRFDMSEFKFANSSFERFKDKLTTAVRHTPYAVLLLDEIEKADPEIMDLLLQVLDDGRLTDNYGRVVNFKDLIAIMTTNSGAKAIQNHHAKSDYIKKDPKRQANFEEQLEIALQGDGYRPEFLARIGAMIVFDFLTLADIERIVALKLHKLATKAKEQGFYIIFEPTEVQKYLPSFEFGYEYIDGVKVVSSPIAKYIADVGYRPSQGVRTIDDTIGVYIGDPVAQAIMAHRAGKLDDSNAFIFRAIGNPPSLTSPYGDWQTVISRTMEGEYETL
ncbi:ATP-dependent Clp protease ATP-binding subunit [Leuconostoc citreum]|uniref:AAA family ATPase n=1 Tax=Leuconostoc citreum TaxID=33964 RepID=UPI00200A89D6|nr:ATP-dependent Clp protease ATP-binding subunit [Leuconostoc citreum]MCK8605736.1 ATP-dependent Clp protease ATP-binding subunit [Leuconostoc citreum]